VNLPTTYFFPDDESGSFTFEIPSIYSKPIEEIEVHIRKFTHDYASDVTISISQSGGEDVYLMDMKCDGNHFGSFDGNNVTQMINVQQNGRDYAFSSHRGSNDINCAAADSIEFEKVGNLNVLNVSALKTTFRGKSAGGTNFTVTLMDSAASDIGFFANLELHLKFEGEVVPDVFFPISRSELKGALPQGVDIYPDDGNKPAADKAVNNTCYSSSRYWFKTSLPVGNSAELQFSMVSESCYINVTQRVNIASAVAPAAPAISTIEETSSTEFTITIDSDSSDTMTDIEMKEGNVGASSLLAQLPAGETQLNQNVKPGVEFCFTATSIDSDGVRSSVSAEKCATHSGSAPSSSTGDKKTTWQDRFDAVEAARLTVVFVVAGLLCGLSCFIALGQPCCPCLASEGKKVEAVGGDGEQDDDEEAGDEEEGGDEEDNYAM
jgi:hypothetical protein